MVNPLSFNISMKNLRGDGQLPTGKDEETSSPPALICSPFPIERLSRREL